MIARRTISSRSTGPIFTIFSPNESVLGADDRPGPFLISQRTLPPQPVLWKMAIKLPLFVALAVQNEMGYSCFNFHINSANLASISCKNFMNFGPVTPELTELNCKLLLRHDKTRRPSSG